MNLYVSKSECSGKKPNHITFDHYYARNNLIASMLQERHAARFVVAPACFGKTALIAEYARSVFSFERVFWFDAQSSCFLRDVDEGAISAGLLRRSPKPGLVVFEDVPRLSPQRVKAFSALLDVLMENGWETIVSMTPRCDVYAEHHSDRILIEALDLLVSENEIEHLQATNELAKKNPSSYRIFERIPCFFWAEKKTENQWLKRFLKEDLSAEMLLCFFIVLFLQQGSLDTLSQFVKKRDRDSLAILARQYVYLGIDIQEECFHSLSFSADVLAKEFFMHLDRIAGRSSYATKNKLIAALVDVLIDQRDHGRACQCMRTLASITQRKEWLEEQTEPLLHAACFYEAHQVYESFSEASIRKESGIMAAEAWRLCFLGSSEEACRLASRVQHMDSAALEHQALTSLLLARYGNEAAQISACQHLNRLIENFENARDFEGAETFFVHTKETWQVLTEGYLALREGPTKGLCYLVGLPAHDYATTVLATWTLQDIGRLYQKPLLDSSETNYSEEMIHQAILLFEEHERTCKEISFLYVVLYKALESALKDSFLRRPPPELTASLASIRIIELSVFEQQKMFVSAPKKRALKRLGHQTDAQDTQLSIRQALPPVLYVKLFGGLDVKLGDIPIDPSFFRRQKVTELLAVLVLYQGKEISRERLLEILWPGTDPEVGKRNYYNVWGVLKKALGTSSDFSSYFIQSQCSCKINVQGVSSDIVEFDALCRKLSFGSVDAATWLQSYEQIASLYVDDILPSEYENEIIILKREEYCERMINACTAAAQRLLIDDEPQAALCFARLATDRNQCREDAYEVLMRAQIKMGQRSAALKAFFKCKTFLADELGIDPSPTLTALYKSIVCDEQASQLGTNAPMLEAAKEVF